MRLGWLLANTDRSPGPFGNESQALMDAWRGVVMPSALVRSDFEGPLTRQLLALHPQ